ncbi:MAG: MFS transporter [Proteobacteria bacterium]|nr:MFS transporter [Pseudomonadota bacterium]
MTPETRRAFAPLAWSNLAAQSAEQICLAAVPIVAVLSLQAGPGTVGALASAQTLPFLLLSIPLGLLADRWPRRRLMLAAEALRVLTLLALWLLVVADRVTLPALAVLGFIGALGTVGFSVAAPALLPDLVPRQHLAPANGRIELARSLAYAGGPALAGALVAWAGAGSAFAAAAALSAAAVALLARLREPTRVPGPRRHPLADIRQGAGFVWQHALLKPILLTAVAWNLAWCVLQAAYVPYAMSRLGLSAAGVGLTLAGYGAGMVLGALAAPRLIPALRYGHAVLLGPLVSVLAAFVMAASTRWPLPALAGLSFFLFGAGPIIWTISSTTLRQHVTPAGLLGRVGAIFLTVNAGARPVGSLIGAWIGAAYGAPACLWLAAAGFVLQAGVIAASPVRVLRRLPTAGNSASRFV